MCFIYYTLSKTISSVSIAFSVIFLLSNVYWYKSKNRKKLTQYIRYGKVKWMWQSSQKPKIIIWLCDSIIEKLYMKITKKKNSFHVAEIQDKQIVQFKKNKKKIGWEGWKAQNIMLTNKFDKMYYSLFFTLNLQFWRDVIIFSLSFAL